MLIREILMKKEVKTQIKLWKYNHLKMKVHLIKLNKVIISKKIPQAKMISKVNKEKILQLCIPKGKGKRKIKGGYVQKKINTIHNVNFMKFI